MHALAGGGDFLGVAATASGKSLCLFAASAAEALARRRREGEAPRQLPPVQLIVVPFANLGPSLQDWGNQFYNQVAASHFPGWECERYFPRVLYAERTWTGGAAPGASDDATPAGMTPRASGTYPKGHMLFFFADSHSARGVARHVAGLILSPMSTHVLCAYPFDGASALRTCTGYSTMHTGDACTPGCSPGPSLHYDFHQSYAAGTEAELMRRHFASDGTPRRNTW